MLVIRAVDPSFAVSLFREAPLQKGLTPTQCREYCRKRGLVSLVAERDDELTGFVVAESCPRAVHFLMLDGDASTCGLLLDRLIRLAGERDVSGWCPAQREDVRTLLEERGFAMQYQDDVLGVPACLYYCNRNGPE